MSGCELVGCNYYKEGRCTDKAEYVNKRTGQPMCKHNPDAVPLWDYVEKTVNLSVSEVYDVLKEIVGNCNRCDDGYIEVYPPHSVDAYTGCGDPVYETYECPICFKARQIIARIEEVKHD